MAKLKRPTNKQVTDACDALDSVRADWMRRPGVTAVDVGFKIKDGQPQDDIAVRVHVERKIPIDQLAESEVLNNDSSKKDKAVAGFPIDVIEATYGPSAGPTVLDHDDEAAIEAINRKRRVAPLIGGLSCGNPRVTAGTIGAIVFDTETCKPMILSNWHVLAGSSSAVAGESITQPGRLDGGTASDMVATLTRMELDSRMDAAVATLDGSGAQSRDILGLGTIAGTEDGALGTSVVKSGRTTGLTRGVIDGVSMTTRINYGDPGVVRFANQIRIVPHPPWPQVDVEISRGGDSGSVWLNEANNNAIGLHFAGETDPAPSSENAICNPIAPIMDELGFSFFPVLCEPPGVSAPAVPVHPLIAALCMQFPFLCGPGGIFGNGGEAATDTGAPDRPDELMLRLLLQAIGPQGVTCCGCCGRGAPASQDPSGDYSVDQLAAVFKRLVG